MTTPPIDGNPIFRGMNWDNFLGMTGEVAGILGNVFSFRAHQGLITRHTG
jgi:hypothetical protein